MQYMILIFCLLFSGLGKAQQKPAEVYESVVVERKMVEVRVLKANGSPVPDLKLEDFQLRYRGKEVTLTSVQWVDGLAGKDEPDGEFFDLDAEVDEAADDAFWDDPPQAEIGGRVIIFFLQKDRSGQIGQDLARLIPRLQILVDDLSPSDYAAVISFDASFRLNQDLTRQHYRIKDALYEGLTTAKGKPFGEGRFPSIGRHISRIKADRVNDIEAAMLVLGDALAKLPGAKTVFFLGYGIGSLGSGVAPHTNLAFEALNQGRATFFVLDAHNADYHSLEGTLKDLARSTGGQYFKTHEVPMNMFNRVLRTVSGHYELIFEPPANAGPRARFHIAVSRPHDSILVRSPFEPGRARKKKR